MTETTETPAPQAPMTAAEVLAELKKVQAILDGIRWNPSDDAQTDAFFMMRTHDVEGTINVAAGTIDEFVNGPEEVVWPYDPEIDGPEPKK